MAERHETRGPLGTYITDAAAEIAAATERDLEMALRHTAEEVAEEAQRRAPEGDPLDEHYDTPSAREHGDYPGRLKDSVEIDYQQKANGRTATISFNTRYAKWQHENVQAKHGGSGQPKFLESALKSKVTTLRRRLNQAIHDVTN